MRTSHSTPQALIGGVLLAVGLVGCSGEDGPVTSDSGATTEPAAFNVADVEFARQMIPHHLQAIEMAGLVAGRTGSPRIRALAESIESAQQPEIDRLSALLKEWGEEAPGMPGTGQHSEHERTGRDSLDGAGMMSQDELEALRSATDIQFDRAWLTMMIAHHEGAVDMARAQLKDGTHADAIEMADGMVAVQQREIGWMRRLLK